MSYRMIAFDMDGTLLDSKKNISPATREAIKYAASCGKTVALSTGRCLAELKEYTDALEGVRFLSCVSGGYVYDLENKKYICFEPMPDSTVKSILDISKQEDCMVQLMNDKSIVSADDVENMHRYGMGLYRDMFRRVTYMVDDVRRYFAEEKPVVVKMCIYHTDPECRERTIARLEKLDIEVMRSETTSAECSNRGITKGKGLKALCEHLGIPAGEVIAVGDADNDAEALKTAGLSIAMGNAKAAIKEMCDAVVSDNDHDGCAEAIYDYLMK